MAQQVQVCNGVVAAATQSSVVLYTRCIIMHKYNDIHLETSSKSGVQVKFLIMSLSSPQEQKSGLFSLHLLTIMFTEPHKCCVCM